MLYHNNWLRAIVLSIKSKLYGKNLWKKFARMTMIRRIIMALLEENRRNCRDFVLFSFSPFTHLSTMIILHIECTFFRYIYLILSFVIVTYCLKNIILSYYKNLMYVRRNLPCIIWLICYFVFFIVHAVIIFDKYYNIAWKLL